MKKIALSALPESQLPAEVGHVSRRFMGGERVTVAQITFVSGSVLTGHRHVNEQFTLVLAGGLIFSDDAGNEVEVGPGEVMHLPSNEWHSARAITDTTVIDVFSPVREDWGTPAT